jgi:hypothetical protein
MRGINRERAAMLGLWGLAVVACVLGLAAPPGTHEGLAGPAIDVINVISTAALTITLVLGPGILLRARRSPRRPDLGFLPLPGLGLLAATAGAAWALADHVTPSAVCLLILAPVLGSMFVSVLRAGPDELLEPEEQRALLVVGCVLGLAIAKALWSLGPFGELYGGSVSRTLEVGGRSDRRIPFHVVQLVAHGTAPFSLLAASYFFPFDFSSRGPLAGLASAPVVLAAGCRPPTALPGQSWAPFDPQGFMAYRMAMMAFACTAFLSLWTLIRSLGSQKSRPLRIAPGGHHPVLGPRGLVHLAEIVRRVIRNIGGGKSHHGRPLRAGLLVGIAYLIHPGALLFVPTLCGLALWPLLGARLRRLQLRPVVLVLAGAVSCLVAWRVINGSTLHPERLLRLPHTGGLG